MKNFIQLSILFILLGTFYACSKKVAFGISEVVPAAQATAKIKKDKNKNYEIDLRINHLASPDRLVPPMEFYVVWISTENNGIKNIGQITSTSSFMSSTLKGTLKAVTSFKPREIFITAEENASVQWPGSMVVVRSESIDIN